MFNDLFFRCRYLLKGSTSISPDIFVFNIDDRDVEELKLTLASRRIFNRFLEHLSKADTRGIIIDILFKDHLDFGEDTVLADLSRKAGNVCLPVVLSADPWLNDKNEAQIRRWLVYPGNSARGEPFSFDYAILPFRELTETAAYMGVINGRIEDDNRLIPLIYKYNNGYIPSLALTAVMAYYKSPVNGILIEWGKQITLTKGDGGFLRIPVDRQGRMRVNFPAPYNDSVPKYTFRKIDKVFQNAVSEEQLLDGLTGGIVFIVDSTSERNDLGQNVYDKYLPLNEVLIAAVNTILTESYLLPFSFLQRALILLLLGGGWYILSKRLSEDKMIPGLFISILLYVLISFILFVYFYRTFDFLIFSSVINSLAFLFICSFRSLMLLAENLLANITSNRHKDREELMTSFLYQILTPLTIMESRIRNNDPGPDVLEHLGLVKRIVSFITAENRLDAFPPGEESPEKMDVSNYLKGILRLYRDYSLSRGVDMKSATVKDVYFRGVPGTLEILLKIIIEAFILLSSRGSEIEISLFSEVDFFILRIKATGVYLPGSLIRKIKNNKVNPRSTWGLLLRLSEAVKADVTLDSWEPGGTLVSLTLPRVPEDPPGITWPEVEEKPLSIKSGKQHTIVYLVNFEYSLKEYFCRYWSGGFLFSFFETCDFEALTFSHPPGAGAILFDLDGLPDEEINRSINTLVKVSEKGASLIYLCGSRRAQLDHHYRNCRWINGYKVKPFYLEELKEELERLLLYRENCMDINQAEIKEFFFENFAKDKKEKQGVEIEKLSLFMEDKVIITRLLEGKANSAISEELNISINTLKKRVQKIYKKCGVKNRNELYAFFNKLSG